MNSSFIIFLERSVACKGYESYMQGLRAEGEFVYIVCNFWCVYCYGEFNWCFLFSLINEN